MKADMALYPEGEPIPVELTASDSLQIADTVLSVSAIHKDRVVLTMTRGKGPRLIVGLCPYCGHEATAEENDAQP